MLRIEDLSTIPVTEQAIKVVEENLIRRIDK
jgi:hypothetical protein